MPINCDIEDKHNNNSLISTTCKRIYFCSRTHSQLNQAVQELRNYHHVITKDIKMTILSSRAHSCTNDAIKKRAINKKTSLDFECKESFRNNNSGCQYFRKTKELALSITTAISSSIWDIEDMINVGKQIIGCPYHAARSLSNDCNIVFAPYNYVLNPNIRKAMNIDLNNAIVIIDEGHNIEDVCREEASIDVSLLSLAKTKDQLQMLSSSSSSKVKTNLTITIIIIIIVINYY